MLTYTTILYQGVEKTLADWDVGTWCGNVQNQASDDLTFSMPVPMDGADVFPYGAQIIVFINRVTTKVNPVNPTLPQTGATAFTGGTQWFWGYCVDNDRLGDPGNESFNYKFVGPYQFFFERLIFQKLMLTWNGAKQIADYQSDVVLGLSLTTLTGAGDTVQGSTATNLMSLAQQIKEICMYAQNDSAYQQSVNGLKWPKIAVAGQPLGAQFQCDQLTTLNDEINYDLLEAPSANVLIADYAGVALNGKTSASVLPAGSFIMRAPLDACNAITCRDAMQRQLQWLGGVGSPVVWTDHSQTPPMLRIGLRSALPAKNLPLTGITVKTKIKKRTDLIPAAVHFKYKVSGSVLQQPYNIIINDVAAWLLEDGTPASAGAAGALLYNGVGQLGALQTLAGGALSANIQTGLMAVAKTATAVVQTIDLQGDQVNAASCKISTTPMNLIDPAGKGNDQGFWGTIFPELLNCTNVAYGPGPNGPTITDVETGTVYYTNGAWVGNYYFINRLVDGQIASWMNAPTGGTPANPTPGKSVKVNLTVRFSGVQNTPGPAGNQTATCRIFTSEEKYITLTLTTLTSGTYYSAPVVSIGEPVPYGLAGYILALESIPQYEGSILVQENEISDVCPIGNVLNITGGLLEWAAMNACIQSVRYADNGQTEITFGPAKHLGAAQFVQRFRNNIGPRWYNLIGGDPLNAANPGTAALGANIAAGGPSPGAFNNGWQSFLASIGSQFTTPVTLPPGIHVDAGAGTVPTNAGPPVAAYGTGAVPSGVPPFQFGTAGCPAIVLAQGPAGGNPGESSAWIRLSINDLKNAQGQIVNVQIYLREIPVCITVGNQLLQYYQLFLCSAPYATSIGQN